MSLQQRTLQSFARFTPWPAALALAFSLLSGLARADTPTPVEVAAFDPQIHDRPQDALDDLDWFTLPGAQAQPFTLGRSRLGGDQTNGVSFMHRSGDWMIGILGIQEVRDGPGEGEDLRNGFVARITRQLFDTARLGFIMTSGDPASGGPARTVGMDLDYRTAGKLRGQAWVQQTDNATQIDGDAHAWGVRLHYPDQRHDVEARFEHYGKAFDPALGQVKRRGVDDTRLAYRFRPDAFLPGTWRPSHTLEGQRLRSVDDAESSGWLRLGLLDASNAEGDRIEGFVSTHREVLVDGFQLVERLQVAPGSYEFTRYGIDLSTSRFERWVLGLQLTRGEYLRGERTDWRVTGAWHASDRLRLDAAYAVNEHRQPGGEFTARTLSVNSELLLLPGLSLAPAVQFNNVNEQLGLKARLRWQTGPGRELLLDWNRTMLRHLEDRLITPLQDSVLRGTMKFRF